jgi:hypothetical protein
VATRSADQHQQYRDLQERTQRRARRRDEQLERILGLQRERHLHSFQSASAPAPVAVLWPAANAAGWLIEARTAA